MPELPEVESIRLQLERFLIGHKINSIEVRNRKIFTEPESLITGSNFTNTRRFGKIIILDLDNKKSLMIHVKMTGQLLYSGPNLVNPKPLSNKISGGLGGPHTHVIFYLDEGGLLYYNDFRRFGWIKIVDTRDVEKTGLVGKMGPEPFKDLKLDHFKNVLSKTKRAVKVVIMDQSKIAGVGNIYANDALYLAKINPKRPASSLNENETKKLYDAIHEVLKEGMKHGGSSENSFVTPDGQEGGYQRHTLVYGKNGTVCKKPACRRAGTKILKIMLGGRGTYFCPHCQKV